MDDKDRDLALLAVLDPDERAMIEGIVDEIVAECGVVGLEEAAQAFALRGGESPDEESIVGHIIAAALRLRALQ